MEYTHEIQLEEIMKADWSNLPSELWNVVGQKLDLGADRIRFRSVSRSLRSSLCFPKPPWLVLSEFDQEGIEPSEYFIEEEEEQEIVEEEDKQEVLEKEEDDKELVVLEDDKVHEKCLSSPLRRGIVDIGQQITYEFDLPEAYRQRFIGSTGTWLITADTHKTIRLLNPFSRFQFELPSLSTFEPQPLSKTSPQLLRNIFILKAIISTPPSLFSTGDCVAMAIYHGQRRVAVARPGDASWITFQTPYVVIEDMIFYREQFYLVNYRGVVMVCEIADDLYSSTASVLVDMSHFEKLGIKLRSDEKLYLVEWMGELLLVVKFLDSTKYIKYVMEEDDYQEHEDMPWYKTTMFKVYKLDFVNKKWDELKSLGDYSLFLGGNTSISILALDYGERVRKNCIYFTDDFITSTGPEIPGGHDMGIFDMENKVIQPHYKGVSTSGYSPPIWLIPTPLTEQFSKLHMEKSNIIHQIKHSNYGQKSSQMCTM